MKITDVLIESIKVNGPINVWKSKIKDQLKKNPMSGALSGTEHDATFENLPAKNKWDDKPIVIAYKPGMHGAMLAGKYYPDENLGYIYV